MSGQTGMSWANMQLITTAPFAPPANPPQPPGLPLTTQGRGPSEVLFHGQRKAAPARPIAGVQPWLQRALAAVHRGGGLIRT